MRKNALHPCPASATHSPMFSLNDLNPEQRAAVAQTKGPVLVLAGAGSGKTKAITYRIAHLIVNCGVPAENILAVTFTNKAAAEMKERVEALVGAEKCREAVIATFHSLGVRLLRHGIQQLGYRPNFSIYASSDQMGLLRQVAKNVMPGKKLDLDAILNVISRAKNAFLEPGQFQPSSFAEQELLAAAIYPRYQSALKACNAIDFDDIIMLAVKLLREKPAVLSHWQQRFCYIMVDEYQDTNTAQYQFIALLAAGSKNLCVVGDDDQSIYGWRGADSARILAFEHDNAGCKVVKLEQNYRSTGTILAAANSVIKNNLTRTDKALWTSGEHGKPIDLLVAKDDEDEAAQVIERLQTEMGRGGKRYRDFAVLYRTNSQSRPFEEQLRLAELPYVLIGGQQFYERKEVKDALAYLRVIVNPRDEQALLRIVNFPRRGVGDTSLLKVNQWALAQGCSVFDAYGRASQIDGLAPAAAEKLAAFHEFIMAEVRKFKLGGLQAPKARDLYQRLKLDEELLKTTEDRIAARRKMENIEQIVNGLAAYEERTEAPTLFGFLERVALLDEDRSKDKKKDAQNDAITLMSLHSSKGLEFPYVFLVGMEEEVLPHKRSIYEDCSIDEERRLCYVGITRARQHLTLTRCARRKRYGTVEERVPSRFLAEIPEELINEEDCSTTHELSPAEQQETAASTFARLRALMDK